jgi:cytochrome c oxidase subunit 4
MSDTHDPYAVSHLPGQSGHGHDDHGHGHHGSHSLTKYIYVFIALCFLTGMSFFTYSDAWPFHETPAVGWVFMMAVSCTKAALVIMVFMHLWWEADWKWVLTIPASIMSAFLVIALIPDVGLRMRRYSEERFEYAGRPIDATDIEKESETLHQDHGEHAPTAGRDH